MAKGLFHNFKGIDAFGKTLEDVKVKTRTGAILTLLSAAIIVTLTTIEFLDYRRITLDTSIIVDKSRGESLNVNMNLTFPRVPCFLLNLDVVDISGEHQRELMHNIMKTRLDHHMQPIHDGEWRNGLGNELDHKVEAKHPGYCGSCYGGLEPESGCCNTCDEVRQAYVNRGWSFSNPDAIEQCVSEHWKEKVKAMATEGCNIAGQVRINKVIGNLQLSPGRAFLNNKPEVYELVPYLKDGHVHGFQHFVHRFQFESDEENVWGNQELTASVKKRLGIVNNPLDDVYSHTENMDYMFQYFMKVVSTKYKTIDGRVLNTHQYSVTQFERDLSRDKPETDHGVIISHDRMGTPGVFINFEISPMQVVHVESRQSFFHFLSSTCAIVGGVLTVASIVDSMLFATSRVLKKGAASVAASGGNGYNSPQPALKMM